MCFQRVIFNPLQSYISQGYFGRRLKLKLINIIRHMTDYRETILAEQTVKLQAIHNSLLFVYSRILMYGKTTIFGK